MSKPLIVFDIDSVLANNDERACYLDADRPDWKAFTDPKNIAKDLPIKPMIAIYRNFCKTARVEIWTGRSETARLITHQWLQKHTGMLPHKLLMRPNDSRLSNLDLKHQYLTNSDRRPALVFDAQPDTSSFWHKRKILVCYTIHS